MFRFNLVVWFFLLVSVSAQADFIESRPVGPGIIHHHEFRSQGPWHIQVLEIDLTNPHVKLETVKADDQLWGYERTSLMAARSDTEAHRIVGAINGDFYASGGIPIGAQVLNGNLLKREYPRSAFGVGLNNEPFIDILSFDGHVFKNGTEIDQINTVNAERDVDKLVLFNSLYGNATGTNNWGTEIICSWIDAPMVNDTRRALVLVKDSTLAAGSGNNDIPDNGFVLSAHGASRLALDSSLFVGDTIDIVLNFSPIEHPIEQLIGGTPRMIREGSISIEWEAEGIGSSFTFDRHPRTAVGFTADSTTLFLFAVDGRQPGFSIGMSLPELANYMMGWGVAEGINLDGGGSTTMVVRGDVVNSPSDGTGERTVANALMVVNTAPTGALGIIDVVPSDFYTLVGTSQDMEIMGYDSTYNPVDVEPASVGWSCDPAIGIINSQGEFIAGNVPGLGFIAAQIDGLLDTAWVTVTQVDSVALTPDPVVLEVDQHQQMQARAFDDQGNPLNLTNADFTWWVTPDIGAINNLGYFSAYHYGSGMIRATYGAVGDSVTASVGSSQAVTFDAFDDVNNWSLTGLLTDMGQSGLTINTDIYISPPSSGQLDYSFTTGGTSVLYMNGEISISGSPDKVFLDIYGDGAGHWMRGEFRCASGDKFLVNFTSADPGIDWAGSWRTVQLDLADATAHWGNPNATLNFPITWTKLYLAEPDDANKNTGVIYLDNFGVSYLTTDAREEIINPSRLTLSDAYPNPFNSTTNFDLEIPYSGVLDFSIFDLQGKMVHRTATQVSAGRLTYSWHADDAATGLYLYRVSLGPDSLMGKCLLLK